MSRSCLVLLLLVLPAGVRAQTVLQQEVHPTNGHTYYLLSESSWLESQAAAESLGGHLVTIGDSEENQWIYEVFDVQSTFFGVWIGFTDASSFGGSEGSFVWTSGEPISYTNWAAGEPNNFVGCASGEDYSHMRTSGQWNDLPPFAYLTACDPTPLPGIVEVESSTTFIRGDCDGDAVFDGIIDALTALVFQFTPGTPEPPCLRACDVDGDGSFNGVVDALAALNHAFTPGAPPPPPPYPDCGSPPGGSSVPCSAPTCP